MPRALPFFVSHYDRSVPPRCRHERQWLTRKTLWAGLAYAEWDECAWRISQVGSKCTNDGKMCPWSPQYHDQRQQSIDDAKVALDCDVERKESGGIFKNCFFQQVFKHSDLANRMYALRRGPKFFFLCSGVEGDAKRVHEMKLMDMKELEAVHVPLNVPNDRLWSAAVTSRDEGSSGRESNRKP